MPDLHEKFSALLHKYRTAPLRVFTVGDFRVLRENTEVTTKDFGRDNALRLFQFLVTARAQRAMHKEQIIDRIWGEELDMKAGEQNFKVALHGANKALEPDRPSRTEPRFILRQGVTYQINLSEIWIDVEAVDEFIGIGNRAFQTDKELAETAFREAINLHHGVYLPNRLYEDWSSDERERLQVLVLGALMTLSEMLLEKNPAESIRLAQNALQLDPAWEDAYRIQMRAYRQKGNRPMVIKTYRACEKILEEEFGIEPLPETKRVLREVTEAK